MTEEIIKIIVGIICLLFPSCVAAIYHKNLFHKFFPVFEKNQLFIIIIGYLFAIITVMAGIGILRGHSAVPYSTYLLTMNNIFKYNILTCLLAVLLPNMLFCGYSFASKFFTGSNES